MANAHASFSDVNETTKYYQAIEFLKNNDVVGGYPDGTFKPEQTLNRAELLKILIEATVEDEIDESKYKNCFPDVKGEWFAKYVCYGKEKGIVNGYPDGTFKPAQYVKKVEAAKMALEAFEFPIPEEKITESLYSDTDSSQWYAKYLKVLKDKNILDEGNVYSPANDISRGQISNYMYRSMAYSFEDFEFLKGVYSKNKYFVFYKNNLLSEADIDTFEAIDESYAKDKKHVYHAGGLIYGADSSTFELFSENSSYAKDGENVYYNGIKIENADADSFNFIDDSDIFAKDKNNFYYNGEARSSVDANTVELMNSVSFKDKNVAYYLLNQRIVLFGDIDDPKKLTVIDKSKSSFSDFPGYFEYNNSVYRIEEADLETFEDLGYGYAKDKNNLYYRYKTFEEHYDWTPTIDKDSFVAINQSYFKDKDHVYYEYHDFVSVDEGGDYKELQITYLSSNPETFEYVNNGYTKDKDNVYFCSGTLYNASPDSFEYLGGVFQGDNYLDYCSNLGSDKHSFTKDKNNVYFYGNISQDVVNFKVFSDYYAGDSTKIYYTLEGENSINTIKNVDVSTFDDLGCGYARDKNKFYLYGKKIKTNIEMSEIIEKSTCIIKDKNNFYDFSKSINVLVPINF